MKADRKTGAEHWVYTTYFALAGILPLTPQKF